jgi:hypothetical protein
MEMSLIELESELAAELPTRSLMSRRHARRHGVSANNGSVANGNSTKQVIFNPQIAIITGVNSAGNGGAGLQANGALIAQAGLNANGNGSTQFGVPENLLG